MAPRPSTPDSDAVTIRVAAEADVPAVAGLLAEVMALHAVTPPGDSELAAIVRTVLAEPNHEFLLARVAGRPAALCALITSYSTWRGARVCEVQDVVVTAEFRGTGLGRRLFAAAADQARQWGCAHLYLTAEYWNLPAHAFYRSLGLEEKTLLYFEQGLRGGPPDETGG